jgi:iron complex transport system ATP-binding protein
MTSSLAAHAISFAYEPGAPVLLEVDAIVRAGGVTGIVGPNGSGKSTLLRVMAGLARADSGEVRLDGTPLTRTGAARRAQMLAYLPQSVNPAFSFTAFEVVCLGRYPHAAPFGGLSAHDVAVARQCLARVNAADLAERQFGTLSGGERQRVLLAGVLAQEPRILLLDEPTASLDMPHARDVFALLRDLARSGYGVGVVTHDLNLAAQYCDTLLLIGAAHAPVATGPPADVLTEARLTQAYGATLRVGRHPFADAPLVCAAGDARA